MTPPIAILGAGPSGLILARLLELQQIDYVVFERDAINNAGSFSSGTLDLHAGSGQLALQEADLFQQFKARARYDTPITMADWHGNVLVKFAHEGETTRPEIDRIDLRQILLESLPSEKICWNRKVNSLSETDDGAYAIQFTDGSQSTGFRLIVAADGAWSKARTLVTNAKPRYSGLHYITTKLTPASSYFSQASALIGKGAYLAIGDGRQISAQKLGDDSYYLAIGLHLPESWIEQHADLVRQPDELRRHLIEIHFQHWPLVHTDLIKHSDGEFRPWPLYAMPPEAMRWQTVRGLTLIGDAAHVSTPFVGEGVNCAMYDSVQLARQIVKHGLADLDSAVAAYEAEMFPRAVDLITRSKRSGDLMFAPDAPAGFLEFLAAQS